MGPIVLTLQLLVGIFFNFRERLAQSPCFLSSPYVNCLLALGPYLKHGHESGIDLIPLTVDKKASIFPKMSNYCFYSCGVKRLNKPQDNILLWDENVWCIVAF